MKILNKLGILKKTPDEAKLPVDDIPVAVRDEDKSAKQQSFQPQKTWQVWQLLICLLYTSPSPRDATLSRMPSSA